MYYMYLKKESYKHNSENWIQHFFKKNSKIPFAICIHFSLLFQVSLTIRKLDIDIKCK